MRLASFRDQRRSDPREQHVFLAFNLESWDTWKRLEFEATLTLRVIALLQVSRELLEIAAIVLDACMTSIQHGIANIKLDACMTFIQHDLLNIFEKCRLLHRW